MSKPLRPVSTVEVRPSSRISARLIRLFGVALIRLIYRIRTVGLEHIPKHGGTLLLPNHVTFADAFFITAACPRPVRFVMDETFMASRVIRIFVRLFDTVTIRQDQPREAIRITIEALKNGDLVCLFPEGQLTRTGTLSELRRGFELIARKAGHPLLPMWCDGAWGSIFSFERGHFFKKIPYQIPYGITVAFGSVMDSAGANIPLVRAALLRCSAEAVSERFRESDLLHRLPRGHGEIFDRFRMLDSDTRRRMWINGYQLGQIAALPRNREIHILSDCLIRSVDYGPLVAFSELYHSPLRVHERLNNGQGENWIGGIKLREQLKNSALPMNLTFYDFSEVAHCPLITAGVTHLPCLAINGIIVATSLPMARAASHHGDLQNGIKAHSRGKLLPGFYLVEGGTEPLRIHGPSAPEEGLQMTAGTLVDAEGFIIAPPVAV